MLSTSVIKNVAQAGHYFSEKDNYYSKEEGMRSSEWAGLGAKRLNLSGEVDPELFTELLKGHLPNGERLGKMVDGEMKHRPGWDLTFSAPKSVSVLALVGGDQRLLQAHRESVAIALAHIEQSCSEGRIKTPQGMVYENTHNIIAALYHHDLSREQDPQLHTHSVIMNITQRSDGKWRSQASQLGNYEQSADRAVHGFIERARNNKRYFGKLYEAELAYRVKNLGYDIQVNAKTGVFEIANVPSEVIKLFSKRRQAIEAHLDQSGFSGAKAAEMATLSTRASKKTVDREELLIDWQERAKSLGFECKTVIEHAWQNLTKSEVTSTILHDQSLTPLLRDHLQECARELSVFKNTFFLEELIMQMLEDPAHKAMPVKKFMEVIQEAIRQQDLISLPTDQGRTVLMSQETLAQEQQLKSQLQHNHPLHWVVDPNIVPQLFSNNKELTSALSALLSDERFVLMEGAYTREVLIKPLLDVLKKDKRSVSILSPTQVTGKHLSESLKNENKTFWESIQSLWKDDRINYQSVSAFLFNLSKEQTLPEVLIVDHTQLLSTQQLSSLVKNLHRKDTKVIFLGDAEFLTSKQRAMPLHEIIRQGMKTVSIAAKPDSIFSEVKTRNTDALLERLQHRVVEIPHVEDRLHAMAMYFVRLTKDEQKNSFLVSHRLSSVNMLNQLTHDYLKQTHQLGTSISVKVMEPVFVSALSGKLAKTYKKDQIIRFNQSYDSLEIHKGDYFRIVDHNARSNTVSLRSNESRFIEWNPDRPAGRAHEQIELFQEKEIDVCVGERIVFQRSIKAASIVKGERLIVQSLDPNSITFTKPNKKSIQLDLLSPSHRHWDYGYASTPQNILYEKSGELILESQNKHTDQRTLFQVMSQSPLITVYTDDLTKFSHRLATHTGDRLTALQVLDESKALKNSLETLYTTVDQYLVAHGKSHTVFETFKKSAQAIHHAIEHLSEREAGFTHKEVLLEAMQYALGETHEAALSDALKLMEKAGIVFQGKNYDGMLWTTSEAIEQEREILLLCQQNKGTLAPMTEMVDHPILSTLNPEQQEAVKTIVSSKDRIMAIQGYAGTGKTTLLAAVSAVLADNTLDGQAYKLRGLTPTHTATGELHTRGIPSQTLDGFLIAMKQVDAKTQVYTHQVLILDEASMVSNQKMKDLLNVVHDFKFRGLVIVGDTRQLSSIEAGKPQTLLQSAAEPIYLTDIRRQKNLDLKKAVKETIDYKFAAAFETLKNAIIEVPIQQDLKKTRDELLFENRLERITQLVNDYASYPRAQQSRIQIITPGHDDKKLANELIREYLKEEGILQKSDHRVPILISKNLTHAEKSRIDSFAEGDVLRFHTTQSKELKAGEYVTIKRIDREHGLLIFDKEEKEVIWQLPQHTSKKFEVIEVFSQEQREIQTGDQIRWSKTDRKQEIIGSQLATILSVEKNEITVELANKKTVGFNPENKAFQHWDHGYASTVYAVQGNTRPIVLAHLESFRERLTTQPAFLVTLTRAVEECRIYTDNRALLLKTICLNHGIKKSALEVIGEFPDKTEPKENKSQAHNTEPKKSSRNRVHIETAVQNNGVFDKTTLERIKDGLNNDAEKIAIKFLGNPKSRGGSYLKFGTNQGSLVVTTKGSKQGYWNDFSDRGGRSMLSFIEAHGNMSRQEAIDFGASWLGILKANMHSNIDQQRDLKLKQEKQEKDEQYKMQERKQQQVKVGFARTLAKQSFPIKDTIVETYLKKHCGIDFDKYPKDIRYHPGIYSKLNEKKLPAMLVIARDATHKIQAVQLTYLDPETSNKIDKDKVQIQKQTFGVIKGSTVSLHTDKKQHQETLIAEGVETGLSLLKALQIPVKVTLGKSNFLSVNPNELAKSVVFCLDNDNKYLKLDLVIKNASEQLNLNGKEILFMIPKSHDNKKQDYNDVIRREGITTIQRDYQNKQRYQEFYEIKTEKNTNIELKSKMMPYERNEKTIDF